MKVKITHNGDRHHWMNGHSWYADKVGHVYEVHPQVTTQWLYRVIEDALHVRYIRKEDCEIFEDCEIVEDCYIPFEPAFLKVQDGDMIYYIRKGHGSLGSGNKHQLLLCAEYAVNTKTNTLVKCTSCIETLIDAKTL